MRILYRPLSLLLFPTVLLAQSQADMQQIMDRLQRLEDQNRELMTEVRALRKELASREAAPQSPADAATNPATAAAQQPSTGGATETPPVEERVAVNEQRIDEMNQSKVEADHKFPIHLTGMLLFNAFANGRNGGSQEYPVAASATTGSASDGATLRQSVLGLTFDGPNLIWGGKASGSLYMDLWGGSGS